MRSVLCSSGSGIIILVERASACGDILYCFKKAFLDYLQGGGSLQLTVSSLRSSVRTLLWDFSSLFTELRFISRHSYIKLFSVW
jgi:hypothetical protein